MCVSESVTPSLAFFKALSDSSRLKIIGLLANQACSVEQLAAQLNIGESTVSHHLSKLSKTGLVSARAEGYFSIYKLETARLEEMSKQILNRETLAQIAPEISEKEVNEIIQRYNDDFASIRRYFIVFKLMACENNQYWRI